MRRDLNILRTDAEFEEFAALVAKMRADGLTLAVIATRLKITPSGIQMRLAGWKRWKLLSTE
jgi:DNA-binding MarR family transcriptional regulator